MGVSGVSMASSIAAVATDMKAGEVRGQIALAVMKQIQDQQKQQAEAILRMMREPVASVATGEHVDVYA